MKGVYDIVRRLKEKIDYKIEAMFIFDEIQEMKFRRKLIEYEMKLICKKGC